MDHAEPLMPWDLEQNTHRSFIRDTRAVVNADGAGQRRRFPGCDLDFPGFSQEKEAKLRV